MKPHSRPARESVLLPTSWYKTLLKCSVYNRVFDHMYSADAVSHIVNIFETEQCDHIKDLSSFRAKLTKKLNRADDKSTLRILGFRDLSEDRSAAMHVVTHYKDLHKITFQSALWNARWMQVIDAIQWLQDMCTKKGNK